VEGLDGIDLTPQFMAPGVRTIFWVYKAHTAARNGKWKLVVDPNEGLGKETLPGTMLFDLEADPSEKRNLAAEQPVITQ
jgi:hypothetical protein